MKFFVEKFEYLFFFVPEVGVNKDYTSGKMKKSLYINWLKWHLRLERK